MEDPHRAGQRDLRVPRDLAQPAPPAQRPGLAVPDRVREPEQDRRGLKLPASPLRRTRGTSRSPDTPGFLCVCQAAGSEVVGSVAAGPGSDLSEELVSGVE